MPSNMTVHDLVVDFDKSVNVDKNKVREMRQNVKLINADHYSKANRHELDVRSTSKKKGKQQLRLTFNFIHRIRNFFTNRIFNLAPGVVISPHAQSEIQDQKVAEQTGILWDHIRNKHNVRDKLRNWIADFFDIGEVIIKLSWNPNTGAPYAGPVQQEVEQSIDEEGNVVEIPIGPKFQESIIPGDIEFERVFGFDFFRDPSAKSMDESKSFKIRKLVNNKELAKKYPDSGVLMQQGDDYSDTFVVFDTNSGAYEKSSSDQVLVMEHYYKPSLENDNKGYYYIHTKNEILAQGPLPGGIFPIIWRGFDEAQTSPRAFSLIRQIKSPQAEINRCLSKIAEHQITLGDDVVFIQKGTQVAPGGYINGQKVIKHTGPQPMVSQGRSGEQYANHLLRMVQWIERIAGIDLFEEKAGGQDAWAQVHKGLKEKEKFSQYGEKIESLLKEVCEMCLRLYKINASDEVLVKIFGKKEMPNLEEFRNTDDLSYQIKVDPGNKDADDQMREQLMANTIMQYSPDMTSEQRALLIRNMTIGGNTEEFEEEALSKHDQAKNLALAIERPNSNTPNINHYLDKEYVRNYLVTRRTRPEMEFLPPEVIQKYDAIIDKLQQLKAEEVKNEQALNADFIPVGGDIIKLDIYEEVPAAGGGTKTQRAQIRQQTYFWLKDRLEKQYNVQSGLSQSADADVSDMGELVSGQTQTEPLG